MSVRLLSAAILGPLVLLLIFFGDALALLGLLLLINAGLFREWIRMRPPVDALAEGIGLFSGALLLILFHLHFPVGPLLFLPLIPLAFLGLAIWRFPDGGFDSAQAGRALLGLGVCLLPLGLILKIRGLEQGPALLAFLLAIIWATDSGAYFSGRVWGKKKLAPRLSPGKTWAGFWGGAISGVVAGWGCAAGFSLAIGSTGAILLGLAISLAGQIGDLAESLIKREAGVKDSGSLIPGHGGLLDRLDSLLFATPILAIYLYGAGLLGG